MEEIKKIQLKEEQQVTNNSSAKNPKRLKPGGGGSGSGSGEEYSESTTIIAEGEYTSGNFKWGVAISASVSVSVSYIWNADLLEYVFNEATIGCSNVCVTFSPTEQGSPSSGVTYTSLAHIPSVPPSGCGGNVTQNTISPVTVPAGLYTLVGYTQHYDGQGNPIGEAERSEFSANLSLNIGFACDPHLGVFGISGSLA